MSHLFRAGVWLLPLAMVGGACATPNKIDLDGAGSVDAAGDAAEDRPVSMESGGNADSVSRPPDVSGDAGSPDVAIPAMFGIADFCALYAKERVFWLDRCGIPRDPDRQVAEKSARPAVCPEPVETGVMQQRFAFHADVARRCLETQFRSCESSAMSPDCNPLLFLQPRVPLGGACHATDACFACGESPLTECVGGICDSSDSACDGKCVPYRAVGEECSRADPAMKCNPETSFCAAGVALRCAARLDENETCSSGESAECRKGLICVSSGGPAGVSRFVCRKPGGVGDPCALDLDWYCAPGLSCAEGRCRTPGGNGDPCVQHGRNPVPCRPQFVCLGRYAQPGVCRAPGAAGAECWHYGHCVTPLTCIRSGGLEAAGRCGSPLAEGAPCLEDQECASGGATGNLCLHQKCTKRPQVGDECRSGGCPPGSGCRKPPPYTAEYGTCLMDPTEGQSCQVDGGCGAGLFCDPSRHCVAKRAEGIACASDDECAVSCRSGRCQRCP
jgi:hypothetical protein